MRWLYRLHSAQYVTVKHLLHDSPVSSAGATSQEGERSDQTALYGYGCPVRLARPYRRLTYLDFSVVCLDFSLLDLCVRWFSLSAHVRFGFLSDATYREEFVTSHPLYHCHSLDLHFRFLRELVTRPDFLLVPDLLCADVL